MGDSRLRLSRDGEAERHVNNRIERGAEALQASSRTKSNEL
jgi:hypothetical protein